MTISGMGIPILDESSLPGSRWSTHFTVLRPVPAMPKVAYIGERHVADQSYRLRGRKNPNAFATLKICIDGCAYFEEDGQKQLVWPGQAMLFASGNEQIAHGIATHASHFDFYRISFYNANPIVHELNKRYGYVLPIPQSHSIVKRLLQFKNGLDHHMQMEGSESAELVWSLLSACARIFESNLPDNKLTRECVDWIHAHVESKHTIADCAFDLEVSQEHLTRVFQENLGQTPGQFLHDERMRHGMQLLVNEQLPIKNVAVRCAYAHASHFSRAFKEHFGVSPSEVRKDPNAWGLIA